MRSTPVCFSVYIFEVSSPVQRSAAPVYSFLYFSGFIPSTELVRSTPLNFPVYLSGFILTTELVSAIPLYFPLYFPGFIPSTELVRAAPAAQKFFLRYILHGMLRFMKTTKSIQQGAQAVTDLATNEKYKGRSIYK